MKISKLDPEFCDAIPQKENMRHGVLYICMACDVAGHLCPCGCGEEVITMFHPKRGWTISYDGKGVTLSPSIGNWNSPCTSHYWIRDNQIIWCSEEIPDVGITRFNWLKKNTFGSKRKKKLRKW